MAQGGQLEMDIEQGTSTKVETMPPSPVPSDDRSLEEMSVSEDSYFPPALKTGVLGHHSSSHNRIRDFSWYDVGCSYHKMGPKKERVRVKVLHGISGHIEAGTMLAVVGPSGAGKTCFLDILAGRKSVGKVTGTRMAGGKELRGARFKKVTAYVPQEDIFHPTATVLDAVMFQARLRHPPWSPYEPQRELALQLIEEVGLKGKEHHKIGGPLPGGLSVRGLSGGERRRLSMCCGAITNPCLLFLDEPTSGLDSFAALMIMRVLKHYCSRGMMVICTIHQPRPAIWSLFQKVLVLSLGHQMYFGDASQAESWFSDRLGYPRQANTSAVDFILDLVSVDFTAKAKDLYVFSGKTMKTRKDVERAAAEFQNSSVFTDHIPAMPVALLERAPVSSVSFMSSASEFFGGSTRWSEWQAMWPFHKSHDSDGRIDEEDEEDDDDEEEEGEITLGDTQEMKEQFAPPKKTCLGRMRKASSSWLWKFWVVLCRNSRNYWRNPGNVLARTVVTLLVATLQSVVYYNIGSIEASQPASVLGSLHIMGSFFYTLMAMSFIPFASLSLFIFDRRFYSGEAASHLYPCSAYYLANMVLETALNSLNAVLYSLLTFYLMDYSAYLGKAEGDSLNSFLMYAFIVVLSSNVGSMILQLFALLTPNQDMCFAVGAGYQASSVLCGGFLVPFTHFPKYARWLQWICTMKYGFQSLAMVLLRGTPEEGIITYLDLNNPPTILGNILSLFGIYIAAFIAAFLCLRYLHLEQR